MEGCLSNKWRYHASIFLPNKYNPRCWTALLVKKLWLVAFDMWDHRCKILHKNYLPNKVQNLENIDRGICSLLHKYIISLCQHECRVFYIIEIEIFWKIPKFRREWLHRSSTIYQTHLARINDPISHRNERLFMQRWLNFVPSPTRITPSIHI